MSYSSNVKEEIYSKAPSTNLEALVELSTILKNKSAIFYDHIEIKVESIGLAKRIHSLIDKLSNLKKGIKYSYSKSFGEHRVYTIIIYNQLGIKEFIASLDFDYIDIINHDELFKAYIRGIFLSNGYIKDPKKEYALDFFMDIEEKANELYTILKKKNKKVFKTKKRNKFLVYFRNSEDILDLLVVMGALQHFFSFEETTMIKELKNKTIREMNWEVANETKTLNTGKNQLKMINFIGEKIGLNELSPVLEEAAFLRLNNPESSLQELAELANISKSGIRNRFRRIEEIYLQLLEEENNN